MNYTQEQIEAFIEEARDRERARCAGIVQEAANYHKQANSSAAEVLQSVADQVRA